MTAVPNWSGGLSSSGYSRAMGMFGATEKKKREPREEFMFGSEPIVAHRLWRVRTLAQLVDASGFEAYARIMAEAHGKENPYQYVLDEVRLCAVAREGSPWSPVPVEAKCNHPAPRLDCECGYWALRTETELLDAFDTYKEIDAYGTVNLWGRYCEFEKGFRAQYAHPKSIVLLNGDDAVAYKLASIYDCEVGCGHIPDALTARRAAQAEATKKQADDSYTFHASKYQQLLTPYSNALLFPEPPKKKWPRW